MSSETKDPPPARELPAFRRKAGTDHRLIVRYALEVDDAEIATTADLAACLAALPEAERAELLAPYADDTLRWMTMQRDVFNDKLNEYIDKTKAAETRATQAEAKLERAMALAAEVEGKFQETRLLYAQLIYEVGTVWPGESRHQTALRFIREREPMNRLGEAGTTAGQRKEEP